MKSVPTTPKRLLKVKEAAAYLSVGKNTMYRLIQQGEFPYIQLEPNGAWWVDVRDLDAWVERSKRKWV